MDIQFGDLNLVFICGRVASEPDLRRYDSGTRQLRMLVTVRSEHPRRRIDVIPVTVWDPDDQLVGPGIEVGSRVMVAGIVQRSLWNGPEGHRSRVEVIGRQVTVQQPAMAASGSATVGAR